MSKKSKNRRVKIVELTLIETIHHMLKESGNFEQVNDIGCFDDGSGMWIDCYHRVSPDSEGKRYVKHLSFNGEGTILEDVQIWVEQMDWNDDKCRQLR